MPVFFIFLSEKIATRISKEVCTYISYPPLHAFIKMGKSRLWHFYLACLFDANQRLLLPLLPLCSQANIVQIYVMSYSHSVQKQEILSHQENISSNQLFSNFLVKPLLS